MSLCDKTLRQWLDEQTEPIPSSMIEGIITQILSGISYIHSKDMVHHDIKVIKNY